VLVKNASSLYVPAIAALYLSGVATAMAAETTPELMEIAVGDPATPATMTVGAGNYVFEFSNLLPGVQYVFTPALKTMPPALPPPLTVVRLTSPPAAAAGLASPCKQAIGKIEAAVNVATTESEIAAIRTKLDADLKAASCSEPEIKTTVKEVKDQTTRRHAETIAIAAGTVLTFKLSRVENQAAKVIGTYEFKTEQADPGQWTTFYGFNYIDSGDQGFYSNDAGTTPPTYTVTPLEDRQEKAFAPSVYFMWIRSENYEDKWQRALAWRNDDVFGGVTAGLGFDFDSPTAFLGYGIGWGYNVMLTAGVVMHKEKRLNGRYSEGDVISENLTEDQLSEETYKPRLYIGIAFRFGSNPFEKPKGN
jgi:hypothetical protein